MQLSTRGKTLRKFPHSLMGKVTFAPVPEAVRTDYILATSDWNVDTSGYSAIICSKTVDGLANQSSPPIVHGVACLDHLTEGDVILIHPTGYIRTLYRINSRHNTIFATDQCNSFCLMCSQPPKDVDDSARIDEHLRLIELMDPSTEELGITGGGTYSA